jgi:hypothetical protein
MLNILIRVMVLRGSESEEVFRSWSLHLHKWADVVPMKLDWLQQKQTIIRCPASFAPFLLHMSLLGLPLSAMN